MATGPLLLLLLHQSCMPLVPFDNGLLETFSEHPTHLPLYLHSLLFISPLIFLSRRKKSDGCGLHTHTRTRMDVESCCASLVSCRAFFGTLITGVCPESNWLGWQRTAVTLWPPLVCSSTLLLILTGGFLSLGRISRNWPVIAMWQLINRWPLMDSAVWTASGETRLDTLLFVCG